MKQHPPKNLDELRDLYGKITAGDHTIKLTKRSLQILKYMLDSPAETATKSISEIAKENEIHVSSITRLAQKLGFDGYHELKKLFQINLKRQRSFYSDQVKRFFQQEHGKIDSEGSGSILDQVIQAEWSNVMMMHSGFDAGQFAGIVNRIIKADQIFVIGLRGSYPLAYYLSFYMQMIRDRVRLIGKSGHILGEELSLLESNGLLIAISVHPYTRATVEACQLCRKKGLDLVVITDSISSPIAMETDNLLVTSSRSSYFFSPIAAVVIYIEALLSELVVQLGDKALSRINRAEEILEKLNIEM